MNKLLFLFLLMTLTVNANEETSYGRIISVKGEGFVSGDGKTHEIKAGEIIKNNSEIVIEHKGQVVVVDNHDHKFILSNSTSVYVEKNMLELRSGDVWVQSLNKNDEAKIQTANAVVKYNGGEAIISYDTEKSKTQLMVINGTMNFSHLTSKELNLTVAEGHFSFVDNSYDQGAPRDPTPVGEKTYRDLVSLFSGVKPMDANSEKVFHEHVADVPAKNVEHQEKIPGRGIASVKEKIVEPRILEEYKKTLFEGKKTHSNNLKVEVLHTAVKKKHMAIKTSHESKLQTTVVQIYGQTAPKKTESISSNRAPASVVEEAVVKENEIENPYIKLLNKQNKESEDLIKKIQSLDMK